MDKKKGKAAVVIAIVAIVILVGSSVARCAITKDTPQEKDPEQTLISGQSSETPEKTEEPQVLEKPAQDTQGQSEEAGFRSLVGTTWQAKDDPMATMAILDGAFVETVNGTTSVSYWALDDEQVQGSDLAAFLHIVKLATDSPTQTIAHISDMGQDSMELTCDALQHAYIRINSKPATLSFEGMNDDLEKLFKVKESDVEKAVANRVSEVSPSATVATWTGEVFIDCINNTAATSFTLNDGAETPITVMRAADNTLEAY